MALSHLLILEGYLNSYIEEQSPGHGLWHLNPTMNHKLRIWFNILNCIIRFVTHGQWHQVWQCSEWCLQEQQFLIIFLTVMRSGWYALRSQRYVIAVQPARCKGSAAFQKHLQRATLPNSPAVPTCSKNFKMRYLQNITYMLCCIYIIADNSKNAFYPSVSSTSQHT